LAGSSSIGIYIHFLLRSNAMSERTLVLVKPDGVARGLVGEVLARIERKGFTFAAIELMTVSPEVAKAHYGEHADKPFFG